MGQQDYINLYKHDFAFAGWLKFGCIGFERNAGLLAPCSVKAFMHGPPHGTNGSKSDHSHWSMQAFRSFSAMQQALWSFSICLPLAAIAD